MKANAVGIFSAFACSFGLWAIARMNGFNHDPVEAGVIKSTAYTFVIAFPIGLAAHTVVALLGWRIVSMIPVAFGIGLIAATGIHLLDGSTESQLVNIWVFLGLPLAFSIPYSLMLGRRAEQ